MLRPALRASLAIYAVANLVILPSTEAAAAQPNPTSSGPTNTLQAPAPQLPEQTCKRRERLEVAAPERVRARLCPPVIEPAKMDIQGWPERYRARFIHFVERPIAASSTTLQLVGARSKVPRYGIGATEIRGERLYEHMGRDDLAKRYRQRRATKIVLIVVGGLFATVGPTLIAMGVQKYHYQTGLSGALMTAASQPLLAVGISRKLHPVRRGALQRLIEIHNQRLLQGTPWEIASTPPPEQRMQISRTGRILNDSQAVQENK